MATLILEIRVKRCSRVAINHEKFVNPLMLKSKYRHCRLDACDNNLELNNDFTKRFEGELINILIKLSPSNTCYAMLSSINGLNRSGHSFS